jgi:carbonic anhydrase/acetyltransferase-like protein (isoleucine patch superfamily)
VGVPAKVIKKVAEKEKEAIEATAEAYITKTKKLLGL